MIQPAVLDSGGENKGSTPHGVVSVDTAGLPTWLNVPGPDFSDDGLPDPYHTIGRHVTVVCVAGVPVGHGEWTRTHAGQCPGCTTLPTVPHANPYARSPAWEAWQAFMRGMPRLPSARPVEPPETGVTLRNKGGWNQYSCVPPAGDPYGIS